MTTFEKPGTEREALPSSIEALNQDAARIGAELVRRDGGTDPFAAAVRATRMPMIVTDPRQPDNPVVFANAAFCRLTGYSREEILGRNCRFLQGPATDPNAVKRIRAAVEAVQSIEIDICNHRKDGTLFWNRLLLAPVRDRAGQLAYFFASQVDVTLERERLAGLEAHNAALMAEVTDRLRAQEASEARLARLLATVPAGIVEVGADGRILYANPAAAGMLGAQSADLLGQRYDDPAWDVTGHDGTPFPPHSLPVAAALRGETVRDVEQALAAKDGRRTVLLVDAVPAPAPDGPGGALAAFQDVTARHDAVQALRVSEARYRTLFKALDAGFCIIEVRFEQGRCVDYRFLEVNPAFKQQTGLADAAGRWIRSLAPTHEQHWFDTYGRVAQTGEPVRFENAAEALGRWYDVHAFRIGEPDARQVAILFNDISARRRTELELLASEARLRHLTETLEQQVGARTAELAASEARFRAYFAASPEPMFLARVPNGGPPVFQDMNLAGERLYGLSQAAVVGQTPYAILDPGTAADVERRARACLALGGPLAYETERRFQSGRVLMLNVVAAPLPAPDGGDALVLFCGRDMTEQRQTEAKLRQSQKMEAVGQLTGGIAHDFNNMLQAIGGSLELLQRRLAQNRMPDADRLAGAARQTVGRAAALTHRLLAFARRQALQPKPVEPDTLIEGVAELIRHTAGPSVRVELQKGGGGWSVLCDPNQLENALLNLAINARDAMPDGGRLVIRTEDVRLSEADVTDGDEAVPGEYVGISVTDTGTGMDRATRARVFEPFFTTKPIGQGTGLGLSQLYGFVRQSGGFVRLDSAPGRGTTVRLCLPRHKDAKGAAPPGPGEAAKAPSQAGAGETVLLVEDEPEVRALAAERLRELGYRVLEAGDGPAALSRLRAGERVNALVTDVGLPNGLNGRQVADAARELCPGLPVLFITGYAGDALAEQLAAGMGVIGKPFALDDLAGRVRDMLTTAPGQPKPSGC